MLLLFYCSFKSLNSYPEMFCKKATLQNFERLTEKHLCRSFPLHNVSMQERLHLRCLTGFYMFSWADSCLRICSKKHRFPKFYQNTQENIGEWSSFLTHFILLVPFYTLWKHHKTSGFCMFSRDLEKDQWHEKPMAWNVLKVLVKSLLHNRCFRKRFASFS